MALLKPTYPWVPFIQCFNIHELHFSTGPWHHRIVLTSRHKLYIITKLPFFISENYFLLYIIVNAPKYLPYLFIAISLLVLHFYSCSYLCGTKFRKTLMSC